MRTEPGAGTRAEDGLRWRDWLRAGDRILCSHMTAEPCLLLGSLAKAQLPEGFLEGVQVDLGVPFSLSAGELDTHVALHAMGGMGSAGRLARTREVAVDRTGYREAVLAYASGARRADVVLVSLAVDANGGLHLGASHGAARDAARHARHVIAEINRRAPVLEGAPWPDDIGLTAAVEVDYAIESASERVPGDVEQRIAGHLADIIPTGACLQVGIGSLPAAVLAELRHHRHLGIHTGMFGDALFDLTRAGAVDNSRKPPDLQQSIVGCVYGSQSLYDAVSATATVRLAHPTLTHSLATLASIANFTAINSAIEVDLLGRVNAESAAARDGQGRRPVGGVGGLPDLAVGALASPGGRSIIALPSQTSEADGQRSRIVARLEHEVTLDAALADMIVTEHGVASLRGASPAVRIERMLAIAAPDERDRLRHEAAEGRLG